MNHFFNIFIFTFLFLCAVATAHSEQVATRYGAGITGGNSYDPSSDLTWVQGTFVALYDYDSVWPHRAPEPLRFKVEAQAGATVRDDIRTIASINMYAHYYLNWLTTGAWRPYIDAGIGIIYTDFQMEGQGLRFNFNPQFGIGTEYTDSSGTSWFTGFRAHHISNGGLDEDNRGINSLALTFGRYF